MIDVTLTTRRESCKGGKFRFNSESWVQLACLVGALSQLIMTFRYFFKTKRFFEKLNKDYKSKMTAVFGPKPEVIP